MTEALNLEDWFPTITEAAAAYGISTTSLMKRIKAGKVRSIKLGWTRLVEKPRAE
jgi:hypothetical protein